MGIIAEAAQGYRPRRSSKIIREELAHMQRVRLRWLERLEAHGTLYRARDGRLWGLKALKAKESPGFFIEFVGRTEHNPLGEVYPQSWQQIEDERGATNWLHDKEQELITVEYLESLVEVPTEPATWVKVRRREVSEDATEEVASTKKRAKKTAKIAKRATSAKR